MADSASESDSSSIDGGPIMMPPSPVTREQLQKRIESLQQQNRVLKVELETYKLRVKALQEENRGLRQASVIIQAKAEQEEEFISNTLLKKIQALKKEKETLAHHYEQEEECLTNDLSRKLNQLRQEKCRLEQTLEQEQECLVNKLMRKIEKLEAETLAKQSNLEQLRREKVELENTLEQEQEALVNKLWKRMDKLEAEKRMLQIKLDQPVSDPASPREISNGDTAANLSTHIQTLRSEVTRLRNQLAIAQQEHTEKMQRYVNEEKNIREENLRLQRKLQLEVERREALCRHLSESESRCCDTPMKYTDTQIYSRDNTYQRRKETFNEAVGKKRLWPGDMNQQRFVNYYSLEMEEERHYNEIAMSGGNMRSRTVSSPIPYNPSPSSSRPLSPGVNLVGSTSRDSFSTPAGPSGASMGRCYACGQATYPALPLGPSGVTVVAPTPLVSCPSVGGFLPVSSSPPAPPIGGTRRTSERFIKPAIPPATAMPPASNNSLIGSHVTPPPNSTSSPSPMDVAKS